MQNIKTLARKAYKNRYDFHRVIIDKQGFMWGEWDDARQKLDLVKLGHIDDCEALPNANRTGVRFYNRDFLVYTFGWDVMS